MIIIWSLNYLLTFYVDRVQYTYSELLSHCCTVAVKCHVKITDILIPHNKIVSHRFSVAASML